jgi:hypothetical protein
MQRAQILFTLCFDFEFDFHTLHPPEWLTYVPLFNKFFFNYFVSCFFCAWELKCFLHAQIVLVIVLMYLLFELVLHELCTIDQD